MGEVIKGLLDAALGMTAPNADPDTARQRASVSQALKLRQEAELFSGRWPEPRAPGQMIPAVSWAQLERQLMDLAETPARAAMARELVSGARKQAAFKPPEMVLREILCLAWVLLDESFQPGLGEGSAEMP